MYHHIGLGFGNQTENAVLVQADQCGALIKVGLHCCTVDAHTPRAQAAPWWLCWPKGEGRG